MKPFTTLTGTTVALDRANIDTDQIIPKQFLKRIERSGFGEFLFWDWMRHDDGSINEEFELNKPYAKGASILLARRNFGSGSSREHAPWALEDFGFRVVVAPSFADIFYNNCFKNGMLPIRLSEEQVEEAFQREAQASPLRTDGRSEYVHAHRRPRLLAKFEVEPFRRHCLLNGLDDIGLTLEHEAKITAYETAHGIGV